jgi:hypothetical protein
MGSDMPLSEKAETIAPLTGGTHVLDDYDDDARAVRRWFALIAEPGARHYAREGDRYIPALHLSQHAR